MIPESIMKEIMSAWFFYLVLLTENQLFAQAVKVWYNFYNYVRRK